MTREKINITIGAMPIETYMGNNETVLVVDDIKTQREIASGILAGLSYSVIACFMW